MKLRLPFRYLQPTFYAGLFDDPVLLVGMRPLGTSLLVDCGQMQHMAKRELKSVDAVFVSHCHMDHFMGLDTLIRNVHVSKKDIDIFGPPGIADKVCRKFAAYDWNLTEPTWCSFRTHEIHADLIVSTLLPGPDGFACRSDGERPRTERIVFSTDHVRVEAEPCDHKIPSLIYRLTEQPVFSVDERKMEELGLVKGEWLRDLKKHLHGLRTGPVLALHRQGETVKEVPADSPHALYESIRREQESAAIGYMTDIGFAEENMKRVQALLSGVTLLVCECSFLAAEKEKARESHHLCTDDLNRVVDLVKPRYVLPMHLSKSYSGRSHELFNELEFPPGVTLLRLPDRIAPRPLIAREVPFPVVGAVGPL